jgi:hypothetical protein
VKVYPRQLIVCQSHTAWEANKTDTGTEDLTKYLQISFLFGYMLCEQASHKRVEQITIQTSRFEVLSSVLIEINVLRFRILCRLVNSYWDFSSNLLLPSSGPVQPKSLFLNYADPEAGASKHFPSVIKYSPVNTSSCPRKLESSAT